MRGSEKEIYIELRGIYVISRQVSKNRIALGEQNTSSFLRLASSEAYLWSLVLNELN